MIGYFNNMKGTHVIMSTFKLSWEELVSMGPCNLSGRVAVFAGRKHLTVRQAIKAGVSIRDLLWVAGKLKKNTQIVKFAKGCANHVAHLKGYQTKKIDVAYAAYAADAAAAYAADAAAADAAYAAAYAAYADAVAATYAAAYAAERKFQQQLFVKIFA